MPSEYVLFERSALRWEKARCLHGITPPVPETEHSDSESAESESDQISATIHEEEFGASEGLVQNQTVRSEQRPESTVHACVCGRRLGCEIFYCVGVQCFMSDPDCGFLTFSLYA